MLNRINFRDFGGEITADGRKIRNGILYRSGIWQKLNDADRAYVTSLNIQYVIDFRSFMNRLHLFTAGLYPKSNLQAAFEVKGRYLLTAMKKVDDVYGGIDKYFMSSGVTAKQLDDLRTLLLEPSSGR